MLELAQTYKKNKDYIVLKNLIVLLTVIITWFAFGYAIGFGTNPEATDIQFGGFYHGWFGDLSGGTTLLTNTTDGATEPLEYTKVNVSQETYD